MPYSFSRRGGKYCMTSKTTKKTYCYKSSTARKKGMRIHEMFKHMPRSKIRIAKK